MNYGLSIDEKAGAWGGQSKTVTEPLGGSCGLPQAQVLLLPHLSSNKHTNPRCAGRVCAPRRGVGVQKQADTWPCRQSSGQGRDRVPVGVEMLPRALPQPGRGRETMPELQGTRRGRWGEQRGYRRGPPLLLASSPP